MKVISSDWCNMLLLRRAFDISGIIFILALLRRFEVTLLFGEVCTLSNDYACDKIFAKVTYK